MVRIICYHIPCLLNGEKKQLWQCEQVVLLPEWQLIHQSVDTARGHNLCFLSGKGGVNGPEADTLHVEVERWKSLTFFFFCRDKKKLKAHFDRLEKEQSTQRLRASQATLSVTTRRAKQIEFKNKKIAFKAPTSTPLSARLVISALTVCWRGADWRPVWVTEQHSCPPGSEGVHAAPGEARTLGPFVFSFSLSKFSLLSADSSTCSTANSLFYIQEIEGATCSQQKDPTHTHTHTPTVRLSLQRQLGVQYFA